MDHLTDERLNEYLDGVLDAEAQAATAVHLQQCPTCQQKLAELTRLFAALDEVAAVELTVDLETAVLAQLAPAPTPIWQRWLPALQLAAALAMGWWLLPTGRGWLAALTLPPWQTPSFDWLADWQTAVATPLSHLPTAPTLTLPAIQWTVLLGLAFALWLITHTLFLREPNP